jgi:hypothetical protein
LTTSTVVPDGQVMHLPFKSVYWLKLLQTGTG